MLGSETQSTLFWLFDSEQTLQRPLQGRAARAPLAGLGGDADGHIREAGSSAFTGLLSFVPSAAQTPESPS